MPNLFPPFDALALHQGNSRNLQLIGVGDDGALYLAAWQSHATGAWTVPDTNVLAFQKGTFSAVALASGNSDRLQLLGLGADQQIYLAAWQYEDGTWLPPIQANAGPMGDPECRYTAVAAHRGGNGCLQVLGLGTDGAIHVVAWQDQGGVWHPDGTRIIGPKKPYVAMLPATDRSGNLQLLALGVDGHAYQAAWQGGDGRWNNTIRAIGLPNNQYAALAVAPGDSGYLQLMGLGTDRKLYLAAWLDGKGSWRAREQHDGRVGKNDRPYAAVTAHTGADGNLEIVCLAEDGKAYLAAWLGKGGTWHDAPSKYSGPLGDPELAYQALVMASGPGSDDKHPGELELVGLGAGFDDGLPYLAATQDGNGVWHAGQPLFSGRSSPMEGNWQTPVPGGVGLFGCMAYDTVWVVTGDRVVRGFDHFTGAETRVFPKFGDNAVPRNVEPFQDGLLVYCGDGWLYFVDLAPDAPDPERIAYCDGEPGWMQPQGGSVFAFSSNSGVVRVPSKAEGVPPSRDGQIVIGAYGTGHTVGWPSLGPDMVLATVTEGGAAVCALDPVNLQRVARCALPAKPSWIQTACNGSVVVLCVNDKKTVCAVPTSLENVAWQAHFSAPVSRQLACDASYCYVPLEDGSVKILNIADGTPARGKNEIKLAQPLDAVLLDGGVLYGASSSGAFLCAIDTATGQVLIERTTGGVTLIGVDNGVVYFGDHKTVRAMRLAGLFRRFYAESTLMQDIDVPAPGLGAPVKAPAIQTEITLYDKSGGPYARQLVRLGATEEVTIRCNGVDHVIGTPDVPFATLPTDVAGRVRIGVRPANLTCPGLALFTTFMDGDLSLLLRPDAQLHDKLANIKGSDLKDAKGYDGQPILKPDYRGDDADAMLDNTAGMMRASIQMVKGSLDNRQTLLAGTLAHRQMRYLARGCDMETICCCPQGDYTCRTVCNQNFAFDLTPANTCFHGDLDAQGTKAWLEAHPLSTIAPPPRPGSPKGAWDDFWDDVKDGAALVQNAIIYAADAVADNVKTVVTWIKEAGTYTFEFVVDTIENAVLLVQGIFNTIVGTVSKVLEALSFLFDRERILDIQVQLKSQVESAWTALLGPDEQTTEGLLFEARDEMTRQLQQMKKAVNQVLDDVRTQASGVSGASLQNQVSGSSNAAAGGSTSRWLEGRVGENLMPSVSQAAPGSRAGAAGIGGVADWMPAFPVPSGLGDDIAALLREVGSVIGDEASRTLTRIQADLDPGGSGSNLFGATFSIVVDLMRMLADIAIEAAEKIWVKLVDVLAKLLRGIRTFITTSFDFPVVSQLYEIFTGRDGSSLTILDLVCLLAAVPVSLAMPASPNAATRSPDMPLPQILGIASGAVQAAATAFMGLFSMAVTTTRAKEYIGGKGLAVLKKFQAFIFLGVGGAARGLLLASDIATNEQNKTKLFANTMLWVFPSLILVGDCISILVVNDSMDWLSKNLSLLFGMGCAIGMALIMGACHEVFEGNWPLIAFNGLVALAFFVRGLLTFGELMPQAYRLAYQLTLIGVVTVLLVGSGAVKVWGSWPSSADAPDPAGRLRMRA